MNTCQPHKIAVTTGHCCAAILRALPVTAPARPPSTAAASALQATGRQSSSHHKTVLLQAPQLSIAVLSATQAQTSPGNQPPLTRAPTLALLRWRQLLAELRKAGAAIQPQRRLQAIHTAVVAGWAASNSQRFVTGDGQLPARLACFVRGTGSCGWTQSAGTLVARPRRCCLNTPPQPTSLSVST